MQVDLTKIANVVQSIAPQSVDADGTVTGATVDLQGYEGAMFVVDAGLWATDGTNTFVAEDSPDDSVWTPVVAAELSGAMPVIDGVADDNTTYEVGYLGSQRYVHVLCVTTANTSGTLVLSATVVRGVPRRAPVA